MRTGVLDTRTATILHKARIGPSKMLSCGRVIGRFSKVTRHTNACYLYQPLKHVDTISISSSRHNSSSNDKPHKPLGTTAKPEECTPTKSAKICPPCEAYPQGSCPASSHNEYEKSDYKGSENGKLPKYWKHLLATLIISGATIYAISQFSKFTSGKSQKSINKDKKEGRRKRRLAEKVKVPATSNLIPQEVPYLLIGGGTAAFAAFRSIKSKDSTAKVLMVTEEEDIPYLRPPLSKELWYNTSRTTDEQVNFTQWNGRQRSLFYEPKEFYANISNLTQSDKGGVAVATGWKVVKVDVTNKIAILEDGREIKYEKCLIATGATPKNLLLFESAENAVKEKIIVFRTKQDFLELEENIYDPECKNIVIIGGGFLGSELACSLARNFGEKKKIFQIYKENYIMAQVLPEYLSEWTTKTVVREGVNCIPNTEIEDFSYKQGKLSLVLTDGRTIDADQVVVAVGVQANTELAESSNLEVHPDIGGFLVNAELEARSNLWVAGDAACFYDVKLGRRRVEHHDHAVISGRLAGENMTGAGKPYLHQSMFWSDLGTDLGYEAIGIVDSSLPTVGVFAKATEADVSVTVNSTDEVIESDEKKAPSKQSEILPKSKSVPKIEESDFKNQNSLTEQSTKHDDFGKGVVFYLRDDTVVGIVLWNIFNRMPVARQVLARDTKYDELNEVAKLFSIHDN